MQKTALLVVALCKRLASSAVALRKGGDQISNHILFKSRNTYRRGCQTKTQLLPVIPQRGLLGNSKNVILVMKLTFILLTAAFMNVSATAVSQNISFTGKDVPLVKVFREIEMQTGLVFFYERGVLNDAHPVTVNAENMPLTQFMNIILKEQPLKFSIESKTINISRRPLIKDNPPTVTIAVSPVIVIRGRVITEKGDPIPGISVVIKGKDLGTFSDDDGRFAINVIDENAILVFSGINFQTREVPVKNKYVLTVVLTPRVSQLESITVGTINTGYQVLDKTRATGAYGKPDMEVVGRRVSTMDVIGRLEGQVAGLQIQIGDQRENANMNGNGVLTRRSLVRGTGTVRLATDPLYVLNGIIVTELSGLNPDDVEDITVLKDAAAAAVYGARAANGVIVITTRAGNKSQRLSVNYNGFINFAGKPDFDYAPTLNSRQYIQAARETFDPVAFPYANLTYSVIAPHDRILYDEYSGLISTDEANRRLDSLGSIDNMDQIKNIWIRNAITNNHTVSISGGNNVYSFYGSLGYTGVQTNDPGNRSDAYKLNFTQNLNAGSRIKIQLNTSLINSITKSKNTQSVSNLFLPYQLFRDEAGNSINMDYLNGYSPELAADYSARSRISLHFNPLEELELGHSEINNLTINLTANVNVNILKGLSFNGTYGYQKSPGISDYYRDNKTLEQRKQIIGLTIAPDINSTPEYLIPVKGGSYQTGQTDQRNWTVRNQLVYDITPRQGRDQLTLQAGQEVNEGYNFRTATSLIGYDEKLGTYAQVDYLRLGMGVPGTVTGYGGLYGQPYQIDKTFTRFISYFGLASYTLNQKYSLDLSIRKDMSNQFANDVSTQNKPIYSIGGKWQIAKEPFMSSVKWINDLALRTTYGITGNSPYVGTASIQDILRPVTPSYGLSFVGGDALALESVANKKLTWEQSTTINLGLDFSIFDRRFSGSFNYYRKNTTDLIGSVRLNPFSGQSGITGNIGELINRGFEASLVSQNIRSSKFNWTTSLTFAYNRNKLLSYSPPSQYMNNASSRLYSPILAGYSLNSIWAYRFAGLDNLGDPQIVLTDKTITKDPNAAKVDDVYYMGVTLPPVHGGLSNSVSYRGINLALNLVYNFGAKMRRDVNNLYSGRLMQGTSFGSGNVSVLFLNRWKNPGDEATTNVPSFVADYGTSYFRRNVEYYTRGDINIVKADYVKVRDVTLSYDLPGTVLRAAHLQRINIYLQATNFMVWRANDTGIDPEFYGYNYSFRGPRPFKHTYSIGLNLSF